jgi:hypothetical protein
LAELVALGRTGGVWSELVLLGRLVAFEQVQWYLCRTDGICAGLVVCWAGQVSFGQGLVSIPQDW